MPAALATARLLVQRGAASDTLKSWGHLPVGQATEKGLAMTLQKFRRFVPALAAVLAVTLVSEKMSAQEINFDQINKFESLGTGTLRVGAPPKTIIDDGERHVVILTIWDADAETKVYWKSADGNVPKTTIIPGKGIQTFQTAGEFRLEAIGEPNRQVEYGYVLLGLRK